MHYQPTREEIGNMTKTLNSKKGNCPDCPVCGNGNAMIDRPNWNAETEHLDVVYTCRDCGHKVINPTVIYEKEKTFTHHIVLAVFKDEQISHIFEADFNYLKNGSLPQTFRWEILNAEKCTIEITKKEGK